MKRTRVLVTGASGFIGSHVARHLAAEGVEVIGIGRQAQPDGSAGLSAYHRGEITAGLLAACAGDVDAVVHCAGSGLVSASLLQPAADFSSNVSTTLTVLDYLREQAPAARLIMLSSAAVYGAVATLPIPVTAQCQPGSPYGVHKQMAESLCASYAHHFGIDVTVLRLFSIYGSGLRKQLLWDACGKITQGQPEFFGSGNELRDWLHVDDVSRLVSMALDRQDRGLLICNGGSGHGVTVRDVISHLASTMATDRLISFTGKARAGDPPGLVADISCARKLGWEPTIPWRHGMTEYVRDYLAGQGQT